MSDKIAFLFPGQGSQFIGMGKDIAEQFPEAGRILHQVDEVCGKPISRLCFEGPMEELTLTVNLQPAITAVSLACLAAISQSGVRPAFSAGHSLGEYAALAAAGGITPLDALKLVKKRGELMHRESEANPGSMAAVLGMSLDAVGQIVDKAKDAGVLAVANHNTADQIVITGEKEALSRASSLIKEDGGKVIPLRVSGAWHSALMGDAVDEFRQFMEGTTFSSPEVTMLFNATAETERDPAKIRELMAVQLVSPVRWYDIILRMMAEGVDCFVEVGPKKVLTGLVKKILPSNAEAKLHNVEDVHSLEHLLEAMAK